MRKVGTCARCGECCLGVRNWGMYLKPTGLPVEHKVTEGCPMLMGKEGDEVRECSIYESHHDFWLSTCQGPAADQMEWQDVIIFFNSCPNCSYEYVEE